MAYTEMKEIVPVSAHTIVAEIYSSILSAESPEAVLVLAQAARVIAETATIMTALETNSISISNGV
jgi:hypothetical protein